MFSQSFLRKLVLLFFIFSLQVSASQQPTKAAKNVIFFIGDGMGLASITGGRIWANGSKGKLAMESFPVTGIAKTYSSSDYVTDSAAAGTALATGVKTYNGAISISDPKVDPKQRSRELETLVDIAHAQGKSIGIVTTTRITHATPAVFYAHQASRDDEIEIAKQILNSHVDLFFGGGQKILNKASPSGNFLQNAKDEGWATCTNSAELSILSHLNAPKNICVFSESHMDYELDRVTNKLQQPSLTTMVETAVQILKKNPKGFFLVVEGGRIDHAAHENKARHVFSELVSFDNAIEGTSNLNFEETLVVVTADHETGGLSLNGYHDISTRGEDLLDKSRDRSYFLVSFASGPGSYEHDNEHLGEHIEVHPSLIPMHAAAHTAVDVIVLAKGIYSHHFSGFQENTDIPLKIAKAMGASFQRSSNLEHIHHQ